VTIYSIHERNADARLEAVPDRFSWFAALLPPVYALVHGLWLALAGYVVAVLALVVGSFWIGADAACWLYVLMAALIGFEAGTLRRLALARRGYVHGGDRIATAEDAALSGWLGHHSRSP
jgi:hypothetical protein